MRDRSDYFLVNNFKLITSLIPMNLLSLKHWFLDHQRDLPWRQNPTPYQIWISEVMLQQTQVSVVIPYYLKWMQRFPSIHSLASASIDEVIKLWEGLGYYSRARHLHAGAKFIVEHFQGNLPSDAHNLKKIKGLGPYTTGAILSFAFRQRVPAVDGNVIRVLTRYYKIENDIDKSPTKKMIHSLAAKLLPDEESWIINEALIELGALICQKKPNCRKCPLKSSCQSYLYGNPNELPKKSKKTTTIHLHRAVGIILHKQYCLVKRVQKGNIMADLHEFPYVESDSKALSKQELQLNFEKEFKLALNLIDDLEPVSHSFTHFRAHLMPFMFDSKRKLPVEGYNWIAIDKLQNISFSSGHRKILNQITTKGSTSFSQYCMRETPEIN